MNGSRRFFIFILPVSLTLLPLQVSVVRGGVEAAHGARSRLALTASEACAQGACTGTCSCVAEPILKCNGHDGRKCVCVGK